MNPTYQFHLYHPQRAALRAESLAMFEALRRSGSVVSRFRRSGQSIQVQPGKAVNLDDLVADDGQASANLYVMSPANQRLNYFLLIHTRDESGEFARLTVEEPYLRDDSSAVSTLLDLAKLLNLHLPVWFAWGDHELNLNHLESQMSLERVSALAWANLFGGEFVARLGQSFLTQAPSYQTQTFKQGVLLTLSPSPLVKPDPALLPRVETYFGIRAISRGI